MRTRVFALALITALLPSASPAQTPQHPWPIRAVIVTTFEIGNDTGDIPGEFQFWVEREHLSETLPFPQEAPAAPTTPPTPSAPTPTTPSSASSAAPPSSTQPPP
jgi:purine nucleoside permease